MEVLPAMVSALGTENILEGCFLLMICFGDHIHWRTLEDGKKEAAARYVTYLRIQKRDPYSLLEK
uniref:Uncharacterized protein n=1 Tax=Meleagris gallopavo TaxID=9103 RepID=A0A803Y5N0_MELGA